ncbi:MAG: Ig-like domain-containing protein [Bacteroidales bacterium]|nr:Ig-like domain-containing protein [Bacteroidales bacterium]
MRTKLFLLTALLTIFACTQEEPLKPTGSVKGTITIAANENENLVLSNIGGSISIRFNATKEWTADAINTRASDWCNVSPTSGPAGDQEIIITVSENPEVEERCATIELVCDTDVKYIYLTQKQKSALIVSQSSFELPVTGGIIDVEVMTNMDFSYTINEDCSSWITPALTKGLEGGEFVAFQVAPNESSKKRAGQIRFWNESCGEVVTVYQEGDKASIIPGQSQYDLSAEEQTITVAVNSNVNVDFSIPSDCDWVSELTTRSLSTNIFYFRVAENEDWTGRDVQITFSNEENNISDYIKIHQSGNLSLETNVNSYEINEKGGEFTVVLKSSVDYLVDIQCDWISEVETKGIVTSTRMFNVEALPEDYDTRTGIIEFHHPQTGLSESVNVYQFKTSIIATPEEFSLNSEEQTISLNVNSNVDYEISIPAGCDWVSKLFTETNSSHFYEFKVESNDYWMAREVEITISNPKSDIKEIVKIYQEGNFYLETDTDQYEIGEEGGTFSVTLESSVDYTVNIINDWITEVMTRGIETSTKTFNVEALPEDINSRCGTVEFIHSESGRSRTIQVIQENKSLALSQKEFHVGADGEEISVDVISYFDVEVSIPDDCDWVTDVTSYYPFTGTYYFKVESNTHWEEREVEITFSNGGNSVDRILKIYQEGTPIIELDISRLEIDENGGTFNVTVESSVEYTVNVPYSWITEVTTRGLDTSVKTFSVDPLPNGTNSRTGYIEFYNSTGEAYCSVSIYQYRGLELDQSYIQLSEGEATYLTATLYDNSKSIYWESSNIDVATVTSSGKVSALSPGTATITAMTTDGKHKATCEVVVLETPKYVYLEYYPSYNYTYSNGYIYSGSQLSWYAYNTTSEYVYVTYFQIVDPGYGYEGNLMSILDYMSPNDFKKWTITFNSDVYIPCIHLKIYYEYNGVEYTYTCKADL